jgi:hypothetical protein
VTKRTRYYTAMAHLTAGTLAAVVCVLPAVAQEEENSRSVHIIDAPLPTPTPVPALAATMGLGSLHGKVNIANDADVTLQILPGPEFKVGSKISFSVKSKRPGYLILVDIDATGKVTQIYPNPISLLHARGLRERSNFLKPGRPLRIPDPENAYSGFEFVATPSGGPAMVVAMLSERPVQLIDLPDLPESVTDQKAALTYLANLAADLRVPERENGALLSTTWSFDASAYAVNTN